jgi:hypothetical protein
VTIDALLDGPEAEEVVDSHRLLLLYQPVHRHGPGTDLHSPGVRRRIALLHAELVEVVIGGDVLVRGERQPVGGKRALHRLQLSGGRFHCMLRFEQPSHTINSHADGPEGGGAGHEGPAVEVGTLGGDF